MLFYRIYIYFIRRDAFLRNSVQTVLVFFYFVLLFQCLVELAIVVLEGSCPSFKKQLVVSECRIYVILAASRHLLVDFSKPQGSSIRDIFWRFGNGLEEFIQRVKAGVNVVCFRICTRFWLNFKSFCCGIHSVIREVSLLHYKR